jgi:hypothetical protein
VRSGPGRRCREKGNDAGDWEQANSRHSLDSGAPNPEHVATDTGADAVLIAERFTYWGRDAPVVPAALRDWDGVDLARPGRDHQWKPHSAEMIASYTAWIDSLRRDAEGNLLTGERRVKVRYPGDRVAPVPGRHSAEG